MARASAQPRVPRWAPAGLPELQVLRVRLTLMANRDIPNLEELEQWGHQGLRAGEETASWPSCRPGMASANTPSAYCVQDVEGEAFSSSPPRNRGSRQWGVGSVPLKEWRVSISLLLCISGSWRARGGAGWGNLSCHLPEHWAGTVSTPRPSRQGLPPGGLQPAEPRGPPTLLPYH